MANRLAHLDLRHHADVLAGGRDALPQGPQILRRPHEGHRHPIHPLRQPELQVGAILLRKGLDRQARCPARSRPWWDFSTPPFTVSQRISGPTTPSTRSSMRPSLSSSRSPAFERPPAIPARGGGGRRRAATSATLNVTSCPASSAISPPGISPTRSFGPHRSCKTASGRPICSLTVRRLRDHRAHATHGCHKRSSAERHPSPPRPSANNTSGEDDAGPTVQTIFVRRRVSRLVLSPLPHFFCTAGFGSACFSPRLTRGAASPEFPDQRLSRSRGNSCILYRVGVS